MGTKGLSAFDFAQRLQKERTVEVIDKPRTLRVRANGITTSPTLPYLYTETACPKKGSVVCGYQRPPFTDMEAN